MIRVLHVLNNLGSGGAESFVMNVYRNIDKEKVQFDFLVRSEQNGPLLDEAETLGAKVSICPPFPRKAAQNYRALDGFLKEHGREYEAIHLHANSLIYVKPLQLARRYGIPKRIMHSHNTKSAKRGFEPVHRANVRRIDKWVTHRLACSRSAGSWMFPNREYAVVPNGIDMASFAYSTQDRTAVRDELGIGNKFVVGHVGRFVPQKNHLFVVDVFEEFHRANPYSTLLLVGEGPDKERVWNHVLRKGLFDDVVFTGAVPDVWRYLSAMDALLFPSLYEGFPVALVEAQANGLPILLSTAISEEVCLLPCFSKLATDESPKAWAEALSCMRRSGGGVQKPCADTTSRRSLAA